MIIQILLIIVLNNNKKLSEVINFADINGNMRISNEFNSIQSTGRNSIGALQSTEDKRS